MWEKRRKVEVKRVGYYWALLRSRRRLLFSSPSLVPLPRKRPVAVCFMTPRYCAMRTVVSNQPAVLGCPAVAAPAGRIYEG